LDSFTSLLEKYGDVAPSTSTKLATAAVSKEPLAAQVSAFLDAIHEEVPTAERRVFLLAELSLRLSQFDHFDQAHRVLEVCETSIASAAPRAGDETYHHVDAARLRFISRLAAAEGTIISTVTTATGAKFVVDGKDHLYHFHLARIQGGDYRRNAWKALLKDHVSKDTAETMAEWMYGARDSNNELHMPREEWLAVRELFIELLQAHHKIRQGGIPELIRGWQEEIAEQASEIGVKVQLQEEAGYLMVPPSSLLKLFPEAFDVWEVQAGLPGDKSVVIRRDVPMELRSDPPIPGVQANQWSPLPISLTFEEAARLGILTQHYSSKKLSIGDDVYIGDIRCDTYYAVSPSIPDLLFYSPRRGDKSGPPAKPSDPAKGGGADPDVVPDTIRNFSPEFRAFLDRSRTAVANARGSALHPPTLAEYQKELGNERRSELEIVTVLSRFLLGDLIDRTLNQRIGGEGELYSLGEALDALAQKEGVVPERLRTWVAAHWEEVGHCTELCLSPSAMTRMRGINPELHQGILQLQGGLRALAMTMGLPGDFFSFHDRAGNLRLRLLPSQVLLSLPNILYGERAVQTRFTHEMSPHSDMPAMLQQRTRPVVISHQSQELHGGRAHPYAAMVHDIWHILRLSALPDNIYQGLTAMDRAMDRVDQFQDKTEIVGNIRDGLIDPGDPTFAQYFEKLATGLTDGTRRRELHHRLAQELRDHPNGNAILASYVRHLPLYEAEAPRVSQLQTQFISTLTQNGAQPESYNLSQELAGMDARQFPVPPWFREWVERNPSLASSLDTRLMSLTEAQLAELRKQDRNLAESLEFLELTSMNMESLAGLPKGFLFSERDGSKYYRFLPPQLWLTLPHLASGTGAMEARVIRKRNSFGEVQQMLREDAHPLLISNARQKIDGYDDVPPWLVVYYDAYHLLNWGSIRPELRQAGSVILDVAGEWGMPVERGKTFKDLLDGETLTPNAVEGLKDLFATLISEHLKTPRNIAGFRGRLGAGLGDNRFSTMVLDAYNKVWAQRK
jgi:hypothetical protein